MLNPPRLLALISLCACSLSRHPTLVAETPTPSAAAVSFEGPGVIEWEAAISAPWEAHLKGLLDLDDPKVKAAGIENEVREIVLPVHLLTHPEHGLFVIDTGISGDLMDGGNGATRGLIRLYLGKLEGVESLASMVERQSAPLTAVFLTHGHIDHVLGLPDLALDAAIYTGPGELQARDKMYIPLRRTNRVLFKKRVPVRTWNPDSATPLGGMKAIDVLGDASLWAIPVPGHTPGSMAFLAHTKRGPVLFVGDSSHTRWGWDNGVPPGLYSMDIDQNRESLEQLRALAGDLDLRVVVGHEWEEEDATEKYVDKVGLAIEFNDGIVDLQTTMMIPWEAYLATSDPEEERQHLAETQKICREVLKTLDELQPYEGGEDMLRSAKEMFQSFMEFLPMSETMLDLRDAEDLAGWSEYEPQFTAADERVQARWNAFLLSQEQFAVSNGLMLEEIPDPVEE